MEAVAQQIDYSKMVERMLGASSMILEDAKAAYIPQAIEKLYRWCIQCDQMNSPKTGYSEVLRIVRIRRAIPKYVFHSLGVNSEDAVEYARTTLGGLYMVVRCIQFSEDYIKNDMKSGNGKLTHYNLPEELKDKVRASTLRWNGDGTLTCLCNSIMTDWIYQGSHYQVLEVTHF